MSTGQLLTSTATFTTVITSMTTKAGKDRSRILTPIVTGRCATVTLSSSTATTTSGHARADGAWRTGNAFNRRFLI